MEFWLKANAQTDLSKIFHIGEILIHIYSEYMYSRLFKYFAFLRNSVYMTTEVPGQSDDSMAMIHEEPADGAPEWEHFF